MPSSIPYDPSLILGNIVAQEKLDNTVLIAQAQAPADAAQSNMNSLITLKRSIDMTVQELIDMNIDVEDLIEQSNEIGDTLKQSAIDYGKAKVASEKTIQPLYAKMVMVSESIESPIDWNRSQIKEMPISSDSMQLNVQYFSNDENDEDSNSHAATISSFVNDSTKSIFGPARSIQASGSVQDQVNNQTSRHSIAGTLVICITCTHKNAQVFAPFMLDVDKAVRVWNKMFSDNMIKTNDAASIVKIEATMETKDDKSFNILSGASYGSSFVGMVHILNTSETISAQSMETIAFSMQKSFSMGGWIASETGGFGVAASFADSAKSLLSTQTVQSHCSLVAMGIIPSLKSNKVDIGVQGFSNFDPAKDMQALAALQNATADENNTIAAGSAAAKTGAQMITLQNGKITATLSGLETIDAHQDSIIDINSMMTAMDDYIQKCIEGGNNLGVPLNYYLKPITQSMIARAWLSKYYPDMLIKGAADDSANSGDKPAS